jgi:hypothetical protein
MPSRAIEMRANWGRVAWLPPSLILNGTRQVNFSVVCIGPTFGRVFPEHAIKYIPANDLDGYRW